MEEYYQPMMEDDHVSSPMKADVSMDMTDDCEGYHDNNDSAEEEEEEEDNEDDDDEGELETPVVLRVKSASSSFRHHVSSSSLRDSDGRSNTGNPNDDTNQESMMMLAPLEPPFAVDDKVLCPHGGSSSSKRPSLLSSSDSTQQLLLYPAVVRKMRYRASAVSSCAGESEGDDMEAGGARGQWEFWVHYVGWHARYDRWARASELVRDTPEQRAQNEARLPPSSSNPAASMSTPSRKRKKGVTETTNDAASKGRANEAMVPDGDEARNAASTKPFKRAAVGAAAAAPSDTTSREGSSASALLLDEYCELPFTLKTVLWDEWERLNPRDYLYHSPDQHNHVNGPAVDVRASSHATTATTHGTAAPRTRLPTRVVHDLPSKATVRYVVSHFCKTTIQKFYEANQPQQSQQPQPSPTEGKGIPATSADSAPRASPTSGASSASVATPEQIQEFCNGLLQLFETALPLCLLYPQEYPQYEALLEEHKRNNCGRNEEPSSPPPPPLQLASVYGCEHLLRLLVRLPVLMQAGGHPAPPRKDPQQSSSSHNKWMGPLLRELIVLLQKNRSQIFTKSNYRPPHAPHEYLEWEQDLYYGLTAKRS